MHAELQFLQILLVKPTCEVNAMYKSVLTCCFLVLTAYR
jgi:hypothetical protein